MALHYVREGLVAVTVDNPSCGELADDGYFDYLASSRFLLEMGWSYLGLSSWQDRVILEWMKGSPSVRPDRIIVSGFSLGTEPMMALGLLDPSIYAFVYNDFLCRTRERILVMNKPSESGERPFPNTDEHLIPGFLASFDFPDIVAALAPRPVICTEGVYAPTALAAVTDALWLRCVTKTGPKEARHSPSTLRRPVCIPSAKR